MDKQSFAGLLRLPTRRESIRVLFAAVMIAVICWYFGVDVWHSILLGCVITVAAVAGIVGISAPDVSVGWPSVKWGGSGGSRSDVANLSQSLDRGWGLVGLTAERRVRQLARHRLALEGLDLLNPDDRPEIERRIGTSAYRILTSRSKRRLSLRRLMYALDALDAANSTYYPAPQSRSRAWDSRRTPSSPREDP